MQVLQRKYWIWLTLSIIWAGTVFSWHAQTIKRLPISQAMGELTLSPEERSYCEELGDRGAAVVNYQLYLPTDTPVLCKQLAARHNRDFAVALLWMFGPQTLALLALRFVPGLMKSRRGHAR